MGKQARAGLLAVVIVLQSLAPRVAHADPRTQMKSPALVVVGSVLLVGSVGLFAGALVGFNQRGFQAMAGVPFLAGAIATLGAGIPMIAVGAQSVRIHDPVWDYRYEPREYDASLTWAF